MRFLRIVSSALGGALWMGCGGVAVEPGVEVTPSSISSYSVTLRTVAGGQYVVAENGGGAVVNANRPAASAWETFTLYDLGGGALQDGDAVALAAQNGQFVAAEGGGGGTLNANRAQVRDWETFILHRVGGGAIHSGDQVALQTSTRGLYVSAINGGGDTLVADRAAASGWETFAITLNGGGGDGGGGGGGGGSALEQVLSRSAFESMFPRRNSFYTYDGFVEATRKYPAFAASGSTDDRKREVAAFLANANHETGGLVYIEEINKGDYCGGSSGCPCAPGKRYFGRGPLQLSWNYNYCAASQSIFGSSEVLRADPDRVAREAWVAWATALFFWMTSTGAGSQTCHNAIVSGGSFGETIRTINGSLECGGRNPGAVQSRVDAYLRFCRQLGVDPLGRTSC